MISNRLLLKPRKSNGSKGTHLSIPLDYSLSARNEVSRMHGTEGYVLDTSFQADTIRTRGRNNCAIADCIKKFFQTPNSRAETPWKSDKMTNPPDLVFIWFDGYFILIFLQKSGNWLLLSSHIAIHTSLFKPCFFIGYYEQNHHTFAVSFDVV